MKLIKYHIILSLLLLAIITPKAMNAEDSPEHYRRLSICNILVCHDNEKFAKEIQDQYLKIPVSDKYNDHNLSVRVVSVDKGNRLKDESQITNWIDKNNVASRLVAKWFDRDILTGECNLDTIRERGLYDASVFDMEIANRSARGIAMLQDAGEDLIGNTFLLMHEITYIDKNKRARVWGAIGQGLFIVAGAAMGSSDMMDMGKSVNDMVSSIKGFAVRVNTRLYRLVWDEERSNEFFTKHYSPGDASVFDNDRDHYRVEYVGNVVSKGGTTSFMGINEDEPELMIRKACQRALDANVADLGKAYDVFRVRTPVVSVSPTITAYIGLKEGVTPDSRYEVLEAEEKGGKISYKRVAVLKPVANKIWDNRFMAVEELAYGADFGSTTFVKESGGDIAPGMLLREITK